MSPRDWFLLVQLIPRAWLLHLLCAALPFPALLAIVRRTSRFPTLLLHGGALSVQRLDRLADYAAWTRSGRRRCLVRSLLVFSLCRRTTPDLRVTLGIGREAGRLRAHAWIGTAPAEQPFTAIITLP